MSQPAPVDLRREAAISAGVNAAISAVFFLVVFGVTGSVPVWGLGNLAFDFIPQSFAVALMATLVPGLLALRALRRAGWERSAVMQTPRSIVARAATHAVAAAILGASLCAAALYGIGVQTLAWSTAIALKVCYGAALGALVTRATLGRVLEPGRT